MVLSSQLSAPDQPIPFPLTPRRRQEHFRVLRRRGDSGDPSLVAGESASVAELLSHCPSCWSNLESEKRHYCKSEGGFDCIWLYLASQSFS